MKKLLLFLGLILFLASPARAGFISQPGGGTESDPVVGAITGIPVGDGAGNISAATSSDLPGAVHNSFDDADHDAINCRYSTGSGDPAPASVESDCHFYKDESTSPVTWWAGVGGAGSNFERITDAAPGVTQVNGTSGSENCDGPCVVTITSPDASATAVVSKAGSVPNEVITVAIQAALGPTLISKIWLPFASCQNTTASLLWDTATSGAPAPGCFGSNTTKGVADFDAASDEGMHQWIPLPSDFTGTVDAEIYWFAAATTGTTRWGVRIDCAAADESHDLASSNNTLFDGTPAGTTNLLVRSAQTGVTITGCAAGELAKVRVYRDADASGGGTDDMTGDARGIGLMLTMRRTND